MPVPVSQRARRYCGRSLKPSENFMKGLVAGIHFAKTHKEESMRITARYMKLDFNKDRAALEETYRVFIDQIIEKNLIPRSKDSGA